MKNVIIPILAGSLFSAASLTAASVNSTFSFGIDAAQDATYTTNPGADNSLADDFTADSPVTFGTSFSISTGDKLVGLLSYHNSAASIGTLTGVSFGGQALNFSTGGTGGFGASVAIVYWDADSDITNGDFSVSFDNSTNGIDEFFFTLYSTSGLVAGGPRDFSSSGGTNPSAIEAASGDFVLSLTQSNNGSAGYTLDADLTVTNSGAFGNLVAAHTYAFADGDTLAADAGSSTGFVTDITNAQGSASPIRLSALASFEAVPEPSALGLVFVGGLALLSRRKRA